MKNYRMTPKQKEVFTRIVKAMHTGKTITRSRKYSGGFSTSYFSFNGHEENAVAALIEGKYLVYQKEDILMINNELLMIDDTYFNLIAEIRVEVKIIAQKIEEKDAEEMQIVKEICADYNIESRFVKYMDLQNAHYRVWNRREDVAKGTQAKEELNKLKDVRFYQLMKLSKSVYYIK